MDMVWPFPNPIFFISTGVELIELSDATILEHFRFPFAYDRTQSPRFKSANQIGFPVSQSSAKLSIEKHPPSISASSFGLSMVKLISDMKIKDELHIILKRGNLEICKHWTFLNIDEIVVEMNYDI